MKMVRIGYLVYVIALACAHLVITLGLWTVPGLGGGAAAATFKVASFVGLFAGWLLAAVLDMVLVFRDRAPLALGGEAILSNLGLAVLLVLTPGLFYFLAAVIPPTLVLAKAFAELFGDRVGVRHA
jgi:hypothetical protein